MNYLDIRTLHISCVILSISLFTLRGGLQFMHIDWRGWCGWRALRVAPHIVDTALLGSAIWLTTLLHQYPFTHGWLTAKFLALLAYILLGREALRTGRTRAHNATAFCLALLCVAYIVGVALTHSPSLGY